MASCRLLSVLTSCSTCSQQAAAGGFSEQQLPPAERGDQLQHLQPGRASRPNKWFNEQQLPPAQLVDQLQHLQLGESQMNHLSNQGCQWQAAAGELVASTCRMRPCTAVELLVMPVSSQSSRFDKTRSKPCCQQLLQVQLVWLAVTPAAEYTRRQHMRLVTICPASA